MTAEIINLRQARRAKARSDKAARAAQNRAEFGRSKTERRTSEHASSKLQRELDGARIDPTAPPAPSEDGGPGTPQ
ncbi:MAG: DUF4169 family protein [Alphaproteobacteria bacterium]|nr:DUF4169 family protein [Alphaproteobacteria bacterium]